MRLVFTQHCFVCWQATYFYTSPSAAFDRLLHRSDAVRHRFARFLTQGLTLTLHHVVRYYKCWNFCCCRSCVRTNLVTRSFSMLTRVRFCRSTTTCHAFRTTSYVDHLVIQQSTTLVIPRSVAGVELAEAPARRQVRQEHECHGWRWTGSSLPQGDGLPHWYD